MIEIALFFRSGRADGFRFAEAMTRQFDEVDVFHLGPWTAQGSRHNVVHWGGPCKEPRASQAGAKRFYHYLCADERCHDLLDEVAEQADPFKATNVPTASRWPALGRPGPRGLPTGCAPGSAPAMICGATRSCRGWRASWLRPTS